MSHYTPAVEDLHVGYCLEVITDKGIIKTTLTAENDWQKLLQTLKAGQIQVPYLTRDQLEAEGWKLSYTTTAANFIWMIRGDYYLKWYEDTRKMQIATAHKNEVALTLFDGVCPSINEYRTIIKLTGIETSGR